MPFYSTAAQIIPVLFLALLFERRFFEPANEAISPGMDIMVVAVFVLGETVALLTLETGRPSHATLAGVACPLVIGSLLLLGPVVNPRLLTSWDQSKTARFPSLSRLFVIVDTVLIYALPLALLTGVVIRAFI